MGDDQGVTHAPPPLRAKAGWVVALTALAVLTWSWPASGQILDPDPGPEPTTSLPDPTTTAPPTTEAPPDPTTTEAPPETTAPPTTAAPPPATSAPARATTTTEAPEGVAPAETTTTGVTFVPPAGVTGATAPPLQGVPPPAGTGALPLLIGLCAAGTTAAVGIVSFRLWRTRPTDVAVSPQTGG